MGYTITRNDNIITITKTGINTIYVTVYIQTYCDSNVWEVIIPRQSTDDTLSITLPNRDDLYRLYIEDDRTVYTKNYVYRYTNFLESLIEDIKYTLCGCACSDCGKNEKDYLSTILKLLSYNIINGSIYNEFLTSTNDCVKCNVLDTNQCLLLNETVLGASDNTLLMKQLIAYYYLVFYYVDLRLNDNSHIITQRYDYDNIIQCIKKLGIDELCIKDNILIFAHNEI